MCSPLYLQSYQRVARRGSPRYISLAFLELLSSDTLLRTSPILARTIIPIAKPMPKPTAVPTATLAIPIKVVANNLPVIIVTKPVKGTIGTSAVGIGYP